MIPGKDIVEVELIEQSPLISILPAHHPRISHPPLNTRNQCSSSQSSPFRTAWVKSGKPQGEHKISALAESRHAGGAISALRRGPRPRRTPKRVDSGSFTGELGDVGREEILSRQPAGEDRPAHLGSHHQGALDLRTGSPADERRTRS